MYARYQFKLVSLVVIIARMHKAVKVYVGQMHVGSALIFREKLRQNSIDGASCY